MNQRIILAGGSGFLGQALAKRYRANGWDVVVLTRSPKERADGVREISWDAETLGAWATELNGAVAVVNLTGRSVDCRYTAVNRKLIMDSRVNSTRIVGEAIGRCAQPPKVWLNSSTATIYKHAFDRAADEFCTEFDSAKEARDAFSVEVAMAWEKTFNEAPTPATRKVILRTTMVLGLSSNSVFPVLRRLTRFGLGGRMGNGRQYVSWIHEEDFCRAIEWLIAKEDFSGPVNLAAPQPLTNSDMMRAMRELCGVPVGLPAPEFALEIGAFFLRTETELILKSRRVVSERLRAGGFEFHFPDFREAIADLEARTGGTKG